MYIIEHDVEFDKSRLRIYVNRKVFTDEFKDSNRKMYNFIRNKAYAYNK